jgi:hypothetical protein
LATVFDFQADDAVADNCFRQHVSKLPCVPSLCLSISSDDPQQEEASILAMTTATSPPAEALPTSKWISAFV